MTTESSDLRTFDFISFDGAALKVHEVGAGRPLLLLHGLFSNAYVNWIKYGHAETLANAGFRLIMPDFRAHGDSDAPHEAIYYPENVIVKDIEALIDYLNLDDYYLAGFSLGARTCAKLVINGARPVRLALSGMGWEGLNGWGKRQNFFLDVVDHYHSTERGDPYYMAVQFMKTTGIDPIAAGHLLRSFGSLNVEVLKEINIATIVICGDQDKDNGEGQALANNLMNGRFEEIAGNHMSSVVQKSLGEKIAHFFRGQ